MNLYNIIQNILDTSKSHRLVKEVGEGDIYQYLNSGEHQYPCVFLTISSVNDTDTSRNVNGTLFYVDRLTSDSSNKVSVQSLGITILGDILGAIEGDLDSVDYTVFTEKFTDLCGGVYANLNITYPFDELCGGDFEIRELEVTSNGVYDTIGYDKVVVAVDTKFVVPDGMKFSMSELSEFPESLDFSEVTDFRQMFRGCNNLITIPQIDTSKGTNFDYMFFNCTKLTTIPQLDTSNGTNFENMFRYCLNLTTIPQIDTSRGTNFRNMFSDCINLITIPQLDISNCESFYMMFSGCTNLTTVPQLDASKGTDFSQMFTYCRNLPTISLLNTSNGTSFSYMFYDCKNLTTVSQLDTSNGTNFNSMFEGCTNLTEIPLLDIPYGTYFYSMFRGCSNISSVELTNTSNGFGFNYMFFDCHNLETVKTIDLSSAYDPYTMFRGCSNLKNVEFEGSINTSINFYDCTLLTYESVKSILTACSNTTNTNAKEVIFNRTLSDQNSELQSLVDICTSKGWTISGLTLN